MLGKRAAIYCRISRDREGLALGTDRQEADCRALCLQRGWQVVDVFRDDDISAFTGKHRPGYESMMSALAAHTVDAIVAYNADRLHRNLKELAAFVDAVNAAHGDVATCTSGDIDLNSADGRMRAGMLGVVAIHASDRSSERIKRKHLEIAQAGRLHGGSRPYGLNHDGTLNRHEVQNIKRCAADIIKGQSIRSVVLRMNASEHFTTTGKPWTISHLSRMLQAAHIKGMRTHIGAQYPAAWGPILTVQQSAALDVLLNAPERKRKGAPTAHLLSGILRCAECGARMRQWTGTKHSTPSYVCPAPPLGNRHVSVAQSQVEPFVSYAVLRRSAGSVYIRGEDEPVPDLAGMLDRQKQLAMTFAAGSLPANIFASSNDALNALILDAQQKQYRQAQRDTDVFAGIELGDVWRSLTVPEQRTAIVHYVERIEVAKVGKGKGWVPERINIVWRR
jgi:DNA invertase Pin-like site-specific DNA recombinase